MINFLFNIFHSLLNRFNNITLYCNYNIKIVFCNIFILFLFSFYSINIFAEPYSYQQVLVPTGDSSFGFGTVQTSKETLDKAKEVEKRVYNEKLAEIKKQYDCDAKEQECAGDTTGMCAMASSHNECFMANTTAQQFAKKAYDLAIKESTDTVVRGVLDSVVKLFTDVAQNKWYPRITLIALDVLCFFALIGLIWRVGNAFVKGGTFTDAFYEIFRVTMVLSFFWVIISQFADFLFKITFTGFQQFGEYVVTGYFDFKNNPQGFSPSAMFDMACDVCSQIFTKSGQNLWNLEIGAALFTCFAGIFVFLALCYIAINYLIAQIKFIFIAYGGLILVALGGFDYTRDTALSYIRVMLANGVRLFAYILLMDFICEMFVYALNLYEQTGNLLSNITPTLILILFAFLSYMLAQQLPDDLASIVSHIGGGSTVTTRQAAHTAAVAAGVGLAAGGVAGHMAAKGLSQIDKAVQASNPSSGVGAAAKSLWNAGASALAGNMNDPSDVSKGRTGGLRSAMEKTAGFLGSKTMQNRDNIRQANAAMGGNMTQGQQTQLSNEMNAARQNKGITAFGREAAKNVANEFVAQNTTSPSSAPSNSGTENSISPSASASSSSSPSTSSPSVASTSSPSSSGSSGSSSSGQIGSSSSATPSFTGQFVNSGNKTTV